MRTRVLVPLAVLGVVTAAVGVVGWLCTRTDTPTPGTPVADVHERMAAALASRGMVAHVWYDIETSERTLGDQREAWLDVATDEAREQTTMAPQSPPLSSNIRRSAVYRSSDVYIVEEGHAFKGLRPTCPDSPKRVLEFFALCPQPPNHVDTHSEADRRFDGVDVLALVATGSLSGIDSVIKVHNTLFVDPFTYLPIAYESKGADRYAIDGHVQHFHATTRYRIEFVQRDSLPSGFFDPASIGYMGEDR